MFQLLSRPLQPGIRFFRHPVPARPTAFLAVRLPAMFRRQPYGLTTFPACHKTDLGSAYSPAVLRRRSPNLQRTIRPHTVWLMPDSSFGTVLLTRFISSSHPLTLSASQRLDPLAAKSLQMMTSRPTSTRYFRGLHCQRSFTPHRYQWRMSS